MQERFEYLVHGQQARAQVQVDGRGARVHVGAVRVVGVREQDLATMAAGGKRGEERRVNDREAQHGWPG